MMGRTTRDIEALFMEAYRLYKEEQGKETKIYSLEDAWRWNLASSRPPRPLESVVLEGNLAQDIIGDVQRFFKSENWYRACGIPFRRGYLLYGPPGCGQLRRCRYVFTPFLLYAGKTSFIQVVAGQLGLNICVLNLSNRSLDDNDLNSRLIDAPPKSIILLEDVDAVFVGRTAAGASSVTNNSWKARPSRVNFIFCLCTKSQKVQRPRSHFPVC